jgi:hypothetical protein
LGAVGILLGDLFFPFFLFFKFGDCVESCCGGLSAAAATEFESLRLFGDGRRAG